MKKQTKEIKGISAKSVNRKGKAERCRFCNKIISGTTGHHYTCKSHLCSRCIYLLNKRNMKGISELINRARIETYKQAKEEMIKVIENDMNLNEPQKEGLIFRIK